MPSASRRQGWPGGSGAARGMHGFGAQQGTPAPSGVWGVRAPGRVDPDALTPCSLRSRSSCAGGPLTGSVLRRGCVRLGGAPPEASPQVSGACPPAAAPASCRPHGQVRAPRGARAAHGGHVCGADLMVPSQTDAVNGHGQVHRQPRVTRARPPVPALPTAEAERSVSLCGPPAVPKSERRFESPAGPRALELVSGALT